MTSAPTRYALADLAGLLGTRLGVSGWLTVDQSRVDLFADATGDDQWIHVDPERAASGPYGATIAHGYLTLSLLPVLVGEAFRLTGVGRRVNYGLDKVRFPSPVVVGARVRAVVTLREVEPVPAGGIRMGLRCVVEIEDGGKPACVADTLTLLMA
ncbi:MaoC family dehydratase [Streptomyces sp. NPDC058001]|uniref:MaoC family dehydratase n=1 Tax=Streptomyces sp. NPDC058001 TaxID=3346300 RepID=UPI0036E6D36D